MRAFFPLVLLFAAAFLFPFSAQAQTVSLLKIKENGVGLGTANPLERADILGNILFGDSETYPAEKKAWFYGRHFNNNQRHLTLLGIESRSNYSILRIGGGNPAHHATTQIDFYTHHNNNALHGQLRMRLDRYGRLGLGVSVPSFFLHLNGSAAKPGGGSFTAASDRRLKTNIHPYTKGLQYILALQPKEYSYNGDAEMPTGVRYVGFIAQELEEVDPEMVGAFVYTDENGKETTYLSVNDSRVRYMLINAIKEQQQQIESQEEQIEEQQQRIEELEADMQEKDAQIEQLLAMFQQLSDRMGALEGKKTTAPAPAPRQETPASEKEGNQALLLQNLPNPFDGQSVVRYTLPEQYQTAQITVANMQGQEVKKYILKGQGEGTITFQASDFAKGVYVYNLVIDGKVVATRKMMTTGR